MKAKQKKNGHIDNLYVSVPEQFGVVSVNITVCTLNLIINNSTANNKHFYPQKIPPAPTDIQQSRYNSEKIRRSHKISIVLLFTNIINVPGKILIIWSDAAGCAQRIMYNL